MVFVFLDGVEPNFQIGLLNSESKSLSEMKVLTDLSAKSVRDLINTLPSEINYSFIGNNTRKGVLSSLLHALCKGRLDLPEKLKFHWIPPFKVPIEDISWIFSFGTFEDYSINYMCNELEIPVDYTKDRNVDMIAKVYFTLIGDFNKLK